MGEHLMTTSPLFLESESFNNNLNINHECVEVSDDEHSVLANASEADLIELMTLFNLPGFRHSMTTLTILDNNSLLLTPATLNTALINQQLLTLSFNNTLTSLTSSTTLNNNNNKLLLTTMMN